MTKGATRIVARKLLRRVEGVCKILTERETKTRAAEIVEDIWTVAWNITEDTNARNGAKRMLREKNGENLRIK